MISLFRNFQVLLFIQHDNFNPTSIHLFFIFFFLILFLLRMIILSIQSIPSFMLVVFNMVLFHSEHLFFFLVIIDSFLFLEFILHLLFILDSNFFIFKCDSTCILSNILIVTLDVFFCFYILFKVILCLVGSLSLMMMMSWDLRVNGCVLLSCYLGCVWVNIEVLFLGCLEGVFELFWVFDYRGF